MRKLTAALAAGAFVVATGVASAQTGQQTPSNPNAPQAGTSGTNPSDPSSMKKGGSTTGMSGGGAMKKDGMGDTRRAAAARRVAARAVLIEARVKPG